MYKSSHLHPRRVYRKYTDNIVWIGVSNRISSTKVLAFVTFVRSTVMRLLGLGIPAFMFGRVLVGPVA